MVKFTIILEIYRETEKKKPKKSFELDSNQIETGKFIKDNKAIVKNEAENKQLKTEMPDNNQSSIDKIDKSLEDSEKEKKYGTKDVIVKKLPYQKKILEESKELKEESQINGKNVMKKIKTKIRKKRKRRLKTILTKMIIWHLRKTRQKALRKEKSVIKVKNTRKKSIHTTILEM
jgi:hypothetical protein